MAKISLRAYHGEIERLIDIGRLREAVAHCKYILSIHPRCIETYRLLGKAFLENQRYGDAADVFQRVLSSVPDDFISHVGMSIIRKDEGNLDEAIWHMQRAFEVQPANGAIQDELRRLIGRRDGMEPPKIRLNRGALARMYIKGNLLDQAIAELQAALAEDAQRHDLRVLLASTYLKRGQIIEAAEAASEVLRHLPNCLEANRILAEALQGTERSNESEAYRQRLIRLEPYFAYTTPEIPDPRQVPEHTINLEKLEWHEEAAAAEAEKPDWAATLGIELEKEAPEKGIPSDWTEPLAEELKPSPEEAVIPLEEESEATFDWGLEESPPPWMSEYEEEAETAAGQAPSVPEPSSEGDIPEWMQEAGWDVEGEGPELISAEPGLEEEIAKAELPDWLKELAPIEEGLESAPPEIGALEEFLAEPSTESPTPKEETPPETDIVFEESQKGGAEIEESVPTEFDTSSQPAPLEALDWLFEEEEETPIEEAGLEDEFDWIGNEAEFSATLEDTQPSQVSSITAPPESPLEEIYQFEVEEGTTVEEIKDYSSTPAQPEPQEPPPSAPSETRTIDEDEAFAWLESLAVKQGAEEALFIEPEKRREQPPEWVIEEMEQEAKESPTEETPIGEEVYKVTPTGIPNIPEQPVEKRETAEIEGQISEISTMLEEPQAPLEREELLDQEMLTIDALIEAETQEEPPHEYDLFFTEFEEPFPPQEVTVKDTEGAPSWLVEESTTADKGASLEPETISRVKPLDLNTASLAELERIPGMGFIKAQEIISYRETSGPFSRIEELLNLSAFTEDMLETLREYVYIESPAPAQEEPLLKLQPTPPSPSTETPREALELLDQARKQLERGKIQAALALYGTLISQNQALNETLQDLVIACQHFPGDFSLWQSLGDAYLRNDQIDEALAAYKKAEELLQ